MTIPAIIAASNMAIITTPAITAMTAIITTPEIPGRVGIPATLHYQGDKSGGSFQRSFDRQAPHHASQSYSTPSRPVPSYSPSGSRNDDFLEARNYRPAPPRRTYHTSDYYHHAVPRQPSSSDPYYSQSSYDRHARQVYRDLRDEMEQEYMTLKKINESRYKIFNPVNYGFRRSRANHETDRYTKEGFSYGGQDVEARRGQFDWRAIEDDLNDQKYESRRWNKSHAWGS